MARKSRKKSSASRHRMDYNESYQKQYIRRYVFKLNTRHDQQLIDTLEMMTNRSAWFKKRLAEEVHHT